jgi:hypothetical protein
MHRSGNIHDKVTFTSGKTGHNTQWMGGYVLPRPIKNTAVKRNIPISLPDSKSQKDTLLTAMAHDKISKYIYLLVCIIFHLILKARLVQPEY